MEKKARGSLMADLLVVLEGKHGMPFEEAESLLTLVFQAVDWRDRS
jgi:hypothetical protein